jgi:hypothetical protein
MDSQSSAEVRAGPRAPTDEGYFTSGGRSAAIGASLMLISSYFVAGHDRHQLVVSPTALGTEAQEDATAAAIAALRLRVALVAAERLADIADAVLTRPNFRYEISRHESVGALAGKLDTARWISRQHKVTSPLTYPILRVERSPQTAENKLAVGALSVLREELEQSLLDCSPPPTSLEARAAETTLERLSRISRMRPFSQLQHHRDRRSTDVDSLISLADEVEKRIDSGRVPDPEPYKRLADWVRAPREAGMVTGADIDWSIYGASFDTVLFELWCIQTLAEKLAVVLGTPDQIPDLRRSSTSKAYVWRLDAAVVGLHFQKSLRSSTARGTLVWKYPSGTGLGGRPDLTISVERKDLSFRARFLYLDPKLRQRSAMPTEEMYKLLGYFSNSGYGSSGKGAILTYAPSPHIPSVRGLRTDDDGVALAVALDPDRPELNDPGLEALVGLVVDELALLQPTEQISLFKPSSPLRPSLDFGPPPQ